MAKVVDFFADKIAANRDARVGEEFTKFVSSKLQHYTGITGRLRQSGEEEVSLPDQDKFDSLDRRETAHFLPLHELKGYWNNGRIREVCHSYRPALHTGIDTIKSHSIRLFSLLVYVDKAQFLDLFSQNDVTDDHLPYSTAPSFLSPPRCRDLVKDLLQYQWMFFPLVLDRTRLNDLCLQEDHILPFQHVEQLSNHLSSEVYKVTVLRSCDKMTEVHLSETRFM